MESIFESLENLNVSEECFNSIMNFIEDYIVEGRKRKEDEGLTVSDVISASDSSIPLRRENYKTVKADSNSTPQKIQAASDRFERAARIKRALQKFRGGRKIDTAVKDVIKQAMMSSAQREEQKQARREQSLQNMWQTQPNHYWNPSGFKYGAKLKTTR